MINIIKIGGNIIDDKEALQRFLKDFAAIEGYKVLIHGGGILATQLADKLHIPQQMVQGRRVTDGKTLDIITMVYGGLINKNIVANLVSLGCTSLGVCGADGDMVRAIKRPVKDIDYGFVGDIIYVNGQVVFDWISKGITPVIAPISHDGNGQLLNTNADTMASEIATGLSKFDKVRLIYCFEKKGVLLDVNDESSAIEVVNVEKFAQLKDDGLVHSGMLPKIENALNTVKLGAESVIIGHASDLEEIIAGKGGTKIVL